MYRHGSVDKTAHRSGVGKPDAEYRRVRQSGHPLADKYGRLWEHRAVLYDSCGAGPQECHYCSAPLDWAADKLAPNAVQVDHLNDKRDDNRPENLVPCCRRCNVAKGQERRHDALLDAGWWSAKDTSRTRGQAPRSRIKSSTAAARTLPA
ncbi:HNH endonuclease [Arthrobacter sp. MP_2.3]|uniref:HNH endonuclease n=1 Tax=Arthrobacter sp. MP_2.3 TaxID=3349633 RepID=UPI0038D46031